VRAISRATYVPDVVVLAELAQLAGQEFVVDIAADMMIGTVRATVYAELVAISVTVTHVTDMDVNVLF
jgi:hypothetical protein